MKQATFSLKEYKFNKVSLDLTNLTPEDTLNIDLIPSGRFIQNEQKFVLNFLFVADVEKETIRRVVEINCSASFIFKDEVFFDEIPSYFYSNSIAIVFPYVRAFISTLTLQANYAPIMLPTMNLMDLNERLKESVTIE